MKIKICGLTTTENANNIANLNPDFIGFIFAEKSKRVTTVAIANSVSHKNKIGVFVNQSFIEIKKITTQCDLFGIQLHGEETPELCKKLKKQFPKVILIKAFSIKNIEDLISIEKYNTTVDYFLFDTKAKQYGGNGITFNWEIINTNNITKPYFLSGGIDITELKNLSKLNQTPYAIDVNSKLEDQIGIKNILKTQNIIQHVKSI